jgi:hypothetical protein
VTTSFDLGGSLDAAATKNNPLTSVDDVVCVPV